jgi:hypothetical protein
MRTKDRHSERRATIVGYRFPLTIAEQKTVNARPAHWASRARQLSASDNPEMRRSIAEIHLASGRSIAHDHCVLAEQWV